MGDRYCKKNSEGKIGRKKERERGQYREKRETGRIENIVQKLQDQD